MKGDHIRLIPAWKWCGQCGFEGDPADHPTTCQPPADAATYSQTVTYDTARVDVRGYAER